MDKQQYVGQETHDNNAMSPDYMAGYLSATLDQARLATEGMNSDMVFGGHVSRQAGHWTTYDKVRPPKGTFEWSVPSIAKPGMSVLVVAQMAVTAGVHGLTPAFAGWDGSRYTVPPGLMWRPTEKSPIVQRLPDVIGIEGLSIMECPHCDKIPTLHGACRQFGAMLYGGQCMHKFNWWWMSCCEWGRTPCMGDPFALESARRAAYRKAAKAVSR